jgi:microcin C transport system ATP-binding protein
VKALAHSLVVMRNGKIVESGAAAAIFARPRDPYTGQLIAAAFDIETAGLSPSGQTD